jgi:sulfite reductase (NADPH) hemoprotein beta-component
MSEAQAPVGLYRYDEVDRAFVHQRVAQFRDQVERFMAGTLTGDEFKPLRLMNGLYLQLHAYMLRVAIPYGVLSSDQLRALARIARRYDRGYGHFTTRQNLQYNWIKLEETADILADLADVDMHALQTSGNCIRNVTTDQFCGAAADEFVDPRVYAEILRQWSTNHPEFTYLPRKFKIAISGSPADRAAVKVHDIGLLSRRDDQGRVGFRVFVGGGLGRTPFVGKLVRDWLPEEDFLAYMEAILRVYNQAGRRDNIYKARIKILVHEMKLEPFRAAVEAEFEAIRGPRFRVEPELVAAIQARFAPPPLETLPAESPALDAAKAANPAFARWLVANTLAHKAPGYACVTLSLKPPGGIPGDATADQMDAVAGLADRYSFGEVRVAHEQNLVFAHVRRDELFALWKALDALGFATANIGHVTDIIACPGLDYCALANARSIPLAQVISTRFADIERQHALGPLTVNISGCINACGHHHVANIGVLGVDKKGEEAYQITIGGNAGPDAAIGDIIGPSVTAAEVPDVIESLVAVYLRQRRDGERFIDTLGRLGPKSFKEALNADAA